MEQLDAKNPLSAEELTELDRLANKDNARALTATLENPTLTRMFEMNPMSPSF
jgi:hypothetical protein